MLFVFLKNFLAKMIKFLVYLEVLYGKHIYLHTVCIPIYFLYAIIWYVI